MTSRIWAVAVMAALAAPLLSTGPVRAEAPPPLEAYGKLPDVDQVSISPSGRRFAFVGATPQGRVIFVSEQGKALARELLAGGKAGGKAAEEMKIDRVAFADEDHVIVEVHQTADLSFYVHNRNGSNDNRYEFRQVALLNLKTHKLSWVFEGEASILHNVAGVYGYGRKDGHSYGFYGGQMLDPRGITEEVDLFRVDLDTGQVVHAAIGPKDWFNYDWLVGPDGTILAHVEYDKRSQQWRLFAEAGHALLASGKDRYGGPALMGMGRIPGTIVYDALDDDGVRHFYETALTPGGPQTPVFDGMGATDLRFDRVTGLISGVVIAADHPDIVLSDPTRQARWKGVKAAFPRVTTSHSRRWTTPSSV